MAYKGAKSKKRLFPALACLLLVSAILTGCVYDPLTYDETLDANWHITFLRDGGCSPVYDKDSGWSFNGDGFRYHVYRYTDEAFITTRLQWTADDRPTYFAESLASGSAWILDELNVKAEKRPDYEQCLYYYDCQPDYSEIILLLDTTKKTIYVCESFF